MLLELVSRGNLGKTSCSSPLRQANSAYLLCFLLVCLLHLVCKGWCWQASVTHRSHITRKTRPISLPWGFAFVAMVKSGARPLQIHRESSFHPLTEDTNLEQAKSKKAQSPLRTGCWNPQSTGLQRTPLRSRCLEVS